MTGEELPLAGCRIGITADRRWSDQAALLTKRGAEVVHGPTMRTVDLSGEQRLRRVTEELVERPPDHLVVTTGMGLRMWLEAASTWGLDGPLKAALTTTMISARGAKSASAVRGAGLELWWRAPGETMEEVVDHLAAAGPPQPRVAVQLFDPEAHRSTRALAALAGELVEVPVYRWLLPDDVGPARRLIEAALRGHLDAVTFTSQPAVRNLVRIGSDAGVRDELLAALNDGVVPACVGPVCAEAAVEEGIHHPLWPDPPRLPAMVRQLTDHLTARSR
ncbi:MAG: uroporphyrinogen-III synthase [Acidimicrobiales bacterium]